MITPQSLSTFCRRALGSPRRRAVLGLLALVAALAGLWGFDRGRTGWPTKAVLRSPGNTLPLAFSPDSRTFATWGADGVTLWDAATGRKRATCGGFQGQADAGGAFSPDGRTFAVAHATHPGPFTIDLIDLDTGQVKSSLTTRFTCVYDLAFADAGRSLRAFLGDVPNNLKVAETWDAATGRPTSSRPLTCPTASCDTEISPDGRLLALAPRSGAVIRIWDLVADRELARLANRSTGVKYGRGLAFSGDARTLAVSREDGSFEIWDLPNRRLRTAFRGHTEDYTSYGIRLAPDGRTLASRGEFLGASSFPGALRCAVLQVRFGSRWRPDPEVIVSDIGTGRRLARAASANFPLYSPDGATIATFESDFNVRLRSSPARPR